MKLIHEFSGTGFHRIVITDGPQLRVEGEWHSYQGIASLQHHSRRFVAVTDYHGGTPIVQSGVIYEIRPVGDISQTQVEVR